MRDSSPHGGAGGDQTRGLLPLYSPLSTPSELLLDDVITSLGVGCWTFMYFTVAAIVPMLLVGNLFVAEFTAPHLNFTCVSQPTVPAQDAPAVEDRSAGSTDEYYFKYIDYFFSNDSNPIVAQLAAMDSMPWREPMSKHCYSVNTQNLAVNQRKLCSRFQYGNTSAGTTITKEFNLVCHKAWFRPLYQMLFTLGCLAGAALGGVAADKYGRQRTVWYGTVLITVSTMWQVLSPNISGVFLGRFMLGVACYIAVNPLTTLALETCPLSFRHAFGPIESLPYSLMMPLLALVAYWGREGDWRLVQLGISLPLLPALILASPWLLDESPRWLVSQGQLRAAERTLRKAAQLNGNKGTLPVNLTDTLATIHKKQTMAGASNSGGRGTTLWHHIWSLVSTYEMLTLTVVTMTMWLIEGTLYISLPLEAESYKSPYIYIAILGLIELPGSFLVAPLGERFGRRSVCCVLSLVTAVQMFLMALARSSPQPNQLLLGTLAVVSYTALVGVSQMIILLTSELFPTTVRSLGSSLGYFMNNVGNCIPPLLDILMPHRSPHTPLLIYGALALANSALVLLLPETNRRRLLETVDEHVQEERTRRRKTRKC